MSTIATVRPKSKPSLPTLNDESRLITDSDAEGVRSTRWADFRAQLLGLIPFRTERNVALGYAGIAADGLIDASILRAALAPEEVANDAAKDALVIVAGDIGRRLVRVTASGILYLAKATGSGADKWIQYNALPAATEALAGVAEIATDAEADAELDDARIITPKKAARTVRRILNPVVGNRASLLGLGFCDGATANRSIVWQPGTAAVMAGAAYSEVDHRFRVPTANPSSDIVVVGWSSGLALSGIPYRMMIEIRATGGLRARQMGALSGTDFRDFEWANFVTLYAGQWVRLDVVFPVGDSLTTPIFYLNGVDVSANFVVATNGAPPNWQPTTQVNSYRHSFFGWALGEFRPGTFLNRVLTAAEIRQMFEAGALLPADRLGGSQVNKFLSVSRNADFSALATDWYGIGTATASAASGALVCTTAADADRVVIDATFTNEVNPIFPVGRRYRISGVISGFAAGGAAVLVFRQGGTGTPTYAMPQANGAFSVEWVSAASGIGSQSLQFRQVNAGTLGFTLDNLIFQDLGAVIQPEITRSAQLLDHGPNRIRGFMTAGIRSLCDRDPVGIRGNITATGNILGLGAADPLWFETGLILSIRVKPTANAVTNTTFRLNTSGGTVIGTVATTTLNQWTTLPFSAGNAFEVIAGDKIHITTDAALDFEIQWARR